MSIFMLLRCEWRLHLSFNSPFCWEIFRFQTKSIRIENFIRNISNEKHFLVLLMWVRRRCNQIPKTRKFNTFSMDLNVSGGRFVLNANVQFLFFVFFVSPHRYFVNLSLSDKNKYFVAKTYAHINWSPIHIFGTSMIFCFARDAESNKKKSFAFQNRPTIRAVNCFHFVRKQ